MSSANQDETPKKDDEKKSTGGFQKKGTIIALVALLLVAGGVFYYFWSQPCPGEFTQDDFKNKIANYGSPDGSGELFTSVALDSDAAPKLLGVEFSGWQGTAKA